ncbi:hypothetical protein CMI47_09515 [Candidatus Pacearchaeota archaeon]|nr:hypothetical protein [Candidatus Pacearchaeota archaeon]
MSVALANFDELIYGEDGISPIRSTLERVLEDAKNDEVRLRIDIRSKPIGVPTSRQEHHFTIDPDETPVDAIMRIMVERLNESPGEGYQGELRINFSQAGASGRRYGSFQRQIRQGYKSSPGQPPPQFFRQQQREEGGYEDEEGEDHDVENSSHAFDHGHYQSHAQQGGYDQSMGGPGIVDQAQARQWLETWSGFTFRSMAQQMAMFERATRMMEAYTLRFGWPTQEPGITEMKGGEPSSSNSGLGILPMLINAAAHLANSGSPSDVGSKMGSMAQGQEPPTGAAREAAIQGAARMIRELPRPPHGGPPDHQQGYMPDGPYPDDPMDPPGGGAYYEDDMGMAHPTMHTPPPDFASYSGDEMKDAVISWVRANPDRKEEVLEMLPDLTKEIM